MLKVGILTSGGDCQSLNAVMCALTKAIAQKNKNCRFYGFKDGYAGLLNNEYEEMSVKDFENILNIGGTILGTSRMSFKTISNEDFKKMKASYKKDGLDCLVILGGNGTHKTAYRLSQDGLNIVTLPKTIDNDIYGTDMTFGFYSAVNIATDAIDCIHTTASSHNRVFIVEIMGHKVGQLCLYAGIAGGADIILIPEIPYSLDAVCRTLEERRKGGHSFSIIAVAEGAISQKEAAMSKKEFKAARAAMTEPSIGFRLARELNERSDQEVRVVNPGHFQRGGGPDAYDRVLTTRLGAGAARLIKHQQYGNMVALKNNEVVAVPLSEVAGKLKMVPQDDQLVETARSIGISFGDGAEYKDDKKKKKDKKKDKEKKD